MYASVSVSVSACVQVCYSVDVGGSWHAPGLPSACVCVFVFVCVCVFVCVDVYLTQLILDNRVRQHTHTHPRAHMQILFV